MLLRFAPTRVLAHSLARRFFATDVATTTSTTATATAAGAPLAAAIAAAGVPRVESGVEDAARSSVAEVVHGAHGVTVTRMVDPSRPLYMDLQATTQVDPRVLDAMMPFMTEKFGNPHSRTHVYGWETQEEVEKARGHVAHLIGADPKEIIFTSGATESNNLALKGMWQFHRSKKNHIITTLTEHKCVLDSCRHLQEQGAEITYLPVQSNGLLDLAVLEDAIRPDTLMVSVMFVNNEIGVIQPIKEIGEICRRRGVYFHTDAAQALGKIRFNVNECNIDLMSMSGHKIYGPKGVGALFVRRKPRRVRLDAILSGGGQERGMRSGTLATPLAVGFGEACRVADHELERDHEHVARLSQRLWNGLCARLSDIVLNGDAQRRYPGNLNVSFAYVEGESLLMALKNIAISSGSACTSASLEPSYVLRALGVEDDLAHTSLRFGLGRFTTEREVDFAVDACCEAVLRLRAMSPLWEMVQEGIDLKTVEWTSH